MRKRPDPGRRTLIDVERDSAALRGVRRAPHPASTDDLAAARVQHPAAWLQSRAGNQAVAQLFRALREQSDLPVRVQRNAKFDDATKTFDKVAAPTEMELPAELKAGMEAAWAASFPEGKSQEQGGILVRTKAGAYEWRAGKGTGSGSFAPNYGDVKAGEVLVASGHTHPYDESEGGATDVAFSGGDLSNLVWQTERVKVVQSGTAQFAVAKTAEFDALVAKSDAADNHKALRDEMNAEWDKAFKGADSKLPFPKRVEMAARAVCTKYSLIYYAGSAGKVKQPDLAPKVHVEGVPPKIPSTPQSLPVTDSTGKDRTNEKPSFFARIWASIFG